MTIKILIGYFVSFHYNLHFWSKVKLIFLNLHFFYTLNFIKFKTVEIVFRNGHQGFGITKTEFLHTDLLNSSFFATKYDVMKI